MTIRLTAADMEFFYSIAAEMFPEGKVPDWISKHPAIRDRKIKKVFPSVGLNNFEEPANIPIEGLIDHQPKHARDAIYAISHRLTEDMLILDKQVTNYNRDEIEEIKIGLEAKIETLPMFSKERNDLSMQLWRPDKLLSPYALNMIEYGKNVNALLINFENYVNVECIEVTPDGKAKLILRHALHLGNKSVAVPGENLARVYGKVKKIVDDYFVKIHSPSRLGVLDDIQQVKIFNSRNIPINPKELKIVFSSTGDKGAWDIATMSMRGLGSCQSWGPQSQTPSTNNACIIGSIASNYVGIIYLTSGGDHEGMGTRMVKRCVVRFGIDMNKPKKERIPVIILDAMYDFHSPAVASAFMAALQKRTKFRVVDFSKKEGDSSTMNIQIPEEKLPKVFHSDEDKDFDPKQYGYQSYKDRSFRDLEKEKVKIEDKTHNEPKLLQRSIRQRSHTVLRKVNTAISNFWLKMHDDLFGDFSDNEKDLYHKVSEFYYEKTDQLYSSIERKNIVLDKGTKFVEKYYLKSYLNLLPEITYQFQNYTAEQTMIEKITDHLRESVNNALKNGIVDQNIFRED